MSAVKQSAGRDGPTWPDFVESFFRHLGAEVDRRGKQLRVTLTREQKHMVEGRPPSLFGWDWNWGGRPPAQRMTWRFLLEPPAGDDADGDGELCVPGSYRGRQVIDAALRLWPVGRCFAGPEPRLPSEAGRDGSPWHWRPFLAFHYRLARIGTTVTPCRFSAAVDLVSGRTKPLSLPLPPAPLFPLHPPEESDVGAYKVWRDIPTAPVRLSVGAANERALARLRADLGAEGDGWAELQRRRVDEEAERLRAYLRRAELEKSAEAVRDVRAARLAELERRRPRVEVDLGAVTVLYVLTAEAQ